MGFGEKITDGANLGSPSTGEPILVGVESSPVVPSPPLRSSRLPFVAAIVGALILLGGGGFVALSAASASGGADTPEQAVDAFLEAASNEDFITIATLVEPSERRTIIEPIATEILPELVRLGVFDQAPNAAKVEGLDLEFTEVTYQIEPQVGNADIVHATFTGGQLESQFDPSELPFSDAFAQQFGDEIGGQESSVENLVEDDQPLVLVEREGRWYISGWFTLAESLRQGAGRELPTLAQSPPSLGSETPELAVENMIQEMSSLDLAGMIGRTDPEEMAALYRYAPLFLAEGQAELDSERARAVEDGYTWEISNLQIESDVSGDDADVLVRGFEVDVTGPDVDVDMAYGPNAISGSIAADGAVAIIDLTSDRWSVRVDENGEVSQLDATISSNRVIGEVTEDGETYNFEIVIDPDGRCSALTINRGGEVETVDCVEEQYLLNSSWSAVTIADLVEEFPGVPFTARQTDGEWYVSPIGSVMNPYIDALGRLEDGEFANVDSAAESLLGVTPIWGLLFYGGFYSLG